MTVAFCVQVVNVVNVEQLKVVSCLHFVLISYIVDSRISKGKKESLRMKMKWFLSEKKERKGKRRMECYAYSINMLLKNIY